MRPAAILSILGLSLPSLAVPVVVDQTLEITAIHTRSSNWLVATVHPLTGCQEIVVDSLRVSDSVSGDTSTRMFLLSAQRRDVSLWLHVDSVRQGGCGVFEPPLGARRMIRLPDPPVAPGSDSLLRNWAPERITSRAPNWVNIQTAKLVDQSGEADGQLCPMFSCIYMRDTVVPPLQEVRDTVQSWLSAGGALILATSGGAPFLELGDPNDSALVAGLGIVSPWTLGNQVWREMLPVKTIVAWGAEPPKWLRKANGRRVYKWAGQGGTTCCQHCDTSCDYFPPGGEMVYTGGDLLLSNDTTAHCWNQIDAGMASDLQGQWLLRPTRAELVSGKLETTFALPGICGGPRTGAFQVVHDSLVYRAGKYALADLLPMSGLKFRGSPARLSVQPTETGWRIAGGESMQVQLRDIHGRILFHGAMDGSLSIAAPYHGLFYLQTGSATVPVIH